MNNGGLIISQDFEMLWGSIGSKSIDSFIKNVKNEDEIIIRTLHLFEKYNIHATWAIVGAMLCKSKQEAKQYLSEDIYYSKWNISLKEYIDNISPEMEKYYFNPNYLEQIRKVEGQEIGVHTFSHFYVAEENIKKDDYINDISATKKIMDEFKISPKTIIMPRNQTKEIWDDVLNENNIRIIRKRQPAASIFKNKERTKIIDFIDAYIPIRKNLCYKSTEIKAENNIYNVRASMFYRTYNHKLRFFEFFKVLRIKHEMTHAAKKNLLLHIWWHPHNMGSNISYNFKQLEKIFIHFRKLNKKYGFKSYNMEEIVEVIGGE